MRVTPPFGLKQFHALNDRITAVESETGERLARVETKVDIVIDLMREERQARATALSETAKTERTRISSRAKVIVALVGAVAAGAGVLGSMLAGCA